MFEDTLVEEDIHPAYAAASVSHIGCVRTSNQDAYVELGDAGLWVVADGMGGYRDGDVAARLVCDGLVELDPALPLEATIDAIRQRMSDVNTRLHQAAVRAVNPIVSGSTVAMFLTRRTACAVIWAGDSRIYRLRRQHLTQLTTDHTWAAELNLQSTGEETDHAITRAVGGEETLLLDVRRDRVHLGDRYLLCSDGLTHELTDEQIAAMLSEGDVNQCAQTLIDATLQAGARDNVTVIVIDAN